MSPQRRAPFAALAVLLRRRFPEFDDPAQLIHQGDVLVNGAVISNPLALVRRDATIRLLRARPLRGRVKLAHALDGFGLEIGRLVVLDLGAAAGQLRGSLRRDPRVVNLERTNLAELGEHLINEPVHLITMDLSYLAVADAVKQLDEVVLSSGARMVALVKPTFELHARSLRARPEEVARAVSVATAALSSEGWNVIARLPSSILGSNGAVEEFLHAQRSD